MSKAFVFFFKLHISFVIFMHPSNTENMTPEDLNLNPTANGDRPERKEVEAMKCKL